jgi:hypothetical protein
MSNTYRIWKDASTTIGGGGWLSTSPHPQRSTAKVPLSRDGFKSSAFGVAGHDASPWPSLHAFKSHFRLFDGKEEVIAHARDVNANSFDYKFFANRSIRLR